MGNRGNVLVKGDSKDDGVYLYSHWGGKTLPFELQKALAKRKRWDDVQYLTRIIFDEMKGGDRSEFGFGISSFLGDNENPILEVNCESQTVRLLSKDHHENRLVPMKDMWTFDDFVALPQSKLEAAWNGIS